MRASLQPSELTEILSAPESLTPVMKLVEQDSTRMEQSQELRELRESHSLAKYFKKEEEKNSQAK